MLAAALLLALAAAAPAQAVHTSVTIDSNPALFAVLAALNAAGYNAGLPAAGAKASPAEQLRQQVRAQLRAHPSPALAAVKAYYGAHHLADPNQDLAQYVTLALFLGNPPGLNLSVPAAGLPPEAAAVQDFVPVLQRYWSQSGLDEIWRQAQPEYAIELSQDSALARQMVDAVDAFFRIPQAYSPRQFYIFPDALLSPGQADALNFEDNYYIAVNLDLGSQMQQVRHTYLHFLLDPLIAAYPAVTQQVEQQVLPLVARAPALGVQFKRDPGLLYTECLVRAVEIQLDAGTPAQKQAKVAAAMSQGLVFTQDWFDQLTAYRADPANFTEFYPSAAFGMRFDELTGLVKHLSFAAAPAGTAAAVVQPERAPGLLQQGEARLDAKDFPAATALANASLRQPNGDPAGAYFLLGKVAAEQNQAAAAVADFQQALTVARADETHIRTWANIFLARLFDAEHNRAAAVAHYQAALASADTSISKSLAQAGIKAPFQPPKPH